MIVRVMTPVAIEIKPGDKVLFTKKRDALPFARSATVTRLTETNGHTFAVLSNCTWRPITSYGRTWKKVENE